MLKFFKTQFGLYMRLTEAIQKYLCQFISSIRFQTEHYTSTGSCFSGSTQLNWNWLQGPCNCPACSYTHVMCIKYIWFLYWFWIRPMISPVSLGLLAGTEHWYLLAEKLCPCIMFKCCSVCVQWCDT